jgi:hypothetical protein
VDALDGEARSADTRVFVAEGHIGGYGGSSPREICLGGARDTMALFAIARVT